MKTIEHVWVFDSSSGDKKYQTLRYMDGTTSCDCPGWTRRVDLYGNRSCKHTRSVDAGIAHTECRTHYSPLMIQPPQPATQPTPKSKNVKADPLAPFRRRIIA